jgi:hypothetical protein
VSRVTVTWALDYPSSLEELYSPPGWFRVARNPRHRRSVRGTRSDTEPAPTGGTGRHGHYRRAAPRRHGCTHLALSCVTRSRPLRSRSKFIRTASTGAWQMRQLRTFSIMVATTAITFAASSIIGTTAAQAAALAPLPASLGGCNTKVTSRDHAYSICTFGSGQQRLMAQCKSSQGDHFSRQGPWVGPGKQSEVSCFEVYDLQIQQSGI